MYFCAILLTALAVCGTHALARQHHGSLRKQFDRRTLAETNTSAIEPKAGVTYAPPNPDKRKINVFLIGDSTHYRIHIWGLVPLCHGVHDPRAMLDFSSRFVGQEGAYLCNKASPLNRIGFSMHWGVASSPYHKMWSKHFAKQDTDNSTENIFIRQREFQNRSLYDGDTRNVYIFLSNLWDVKRYTDNFAKTQKIADWLREFKTNYTKVVLQLRSNLGPHDILFLETLHHTVGWDDHNQMINKIVREVVKEHDFSLFDVTHILGSCTKCICIDDIHQNEKASLYLAEYLLNHMVKYHEDGKSSHIGAYNQDEG